MPNYKDLTKENSNFFETIPVERESWIPVSQQLESLIENLACLNGEKENITSAEFKEYLNNAGELIKQGYKFLDDNKELFKEKQFKMLRENTEILLANAQSIHTFLDVHSQIEGYRTGIKNK